MARARALVAAGLVAFVLVTTGGSCSDGEVAEEHRKLSLRIEHLPLHRTVAGESAVIRARVQSSLQGPKIEGWVRVIDAEGGEERIALEISGDGDAVAKLPARPKGESVRYVIEARDAAGLVVALPRDAEDGGYYTLQFEGPSSRVLGAVSFVSAVIAALFYLGAGAAAVQSLRGRMSVGPAGLLGGMGAALVIVGLFVLGGIHAFQATGRPWPPEPVFLALGRGDLAIATLLWIGNLALGRRVLLDDEIDAASRGERGFAVTAVVVAVLVLFSGLF